MALADQAKSRASSSSSASSSLKAKATSRAASKSSTSSSKTTKPVSKGASMTTYGPDSDNAGKTMKESKGIIPPLSKEAEIPAVPHFDYITSYSRIPSLRKRPIGG